MPLSAERVFIGDGDNASMNVDLVKNYLFEGGKIGKECILEIMRRAK